jgi:hypothetical protein
VALHEDAAAGTRPGRRGRLRLSSTQRARRPGRHADVLDRIDQIVAPRVTVNPDDNSYGTHELTTAARRR